MSETSNIVTGQPKMYIVSANTKKNIYLLFYSRHAEINISDASSVFSLIKILNIMTNINYVASQMYRFI